MIARCFVTGFDIQDGIMHVNVMALDTEDSLIMGSGSVDLGDETLQLRLVGEPKDPELGAGRVPVHVTGRFTDVSVDVDASALLARGAVAVGLGALATPLAALLALLDPVTVEDSDCPGLIEYGRQHVQ